MKNTPYFYSDNNTLNRAARIALGDIAANCVPYCDGLLTEEKFCVMAGLDYKTPWTRDTAINTMSAVCIMDPEIAKHTLLSVCEQRDGKNYIGGEYWDAIIWAIGAWQYYIVNSDEKFLDFALDTIQNSIAWFEEREFDEEVGLFMGAAVYGDGIAAYPDKYTKTVNNSTGIAEWPGANPEKRSKKGHGVPMKTLSTNCVYYAAYMVAAKMLKLRNRDNAIYVEKAEAVRAAINRHFWNEETGRYDYLFDDELRCGYAEGLGLSFAILFGLADEEKCEKIIRNTYITEQGIPCLWPSFDRYLVGEDYGRHAGTVWPHVQGFWALAMLKADSPAGFDKELFAMADKAVRDVQFAEIYHPVTGEIYGGLQETMHGGIRVWGSCQKQTWSATLFWALIFYGMVGLDYKENCVSVTPYLPEGVNHAELKGLQVGDATVTIIIERGAKAERATTISKNLKGTHTFCLSVD